MIARKSTLIIGTRFLNAVLGYVALFFIARFMGRFPLGVIGFGLGFVSLFRIISQLGFDRAHVKRISEGKRLDRCIGTYLTVKIGLTGLMAAAILGTIFFWRYGMGTSFVSGTHETVIYILLAYFVLFSLTQTMLVTFRARKEIAKVQIPLFFETLGRVIATILVALSGLGAIALASTFLVGECVLLITALAFFKGYPIGKPTKEYFKSYYTFALPLIIVVASVTIMTNLDRVMIQLFWEAENVGDYFAIYRISEFVVMFTLAIGMLLFPTISAYHVAKKAKEIRNLTLVAERYLSMVVFPIVFFLAALAGPIIHITLSDKFYPAIPILRILPFFALLVSLTHPYSVQFVGMNRPGLATKHAILMVCVNVALNLLLVPRDIGILGVECIGLGAVGAAIATVVAYGAGLVYVRAAAWKLSGTKGSFRILLHLIAALVMAYALHYLSTMFFVYRWYHLLGYAFLGLGIYLGMLWLLREFEKADFEFFIDTLNLGKMKDYIIGEIRGLR